MSQNYFAELYVADLMANAGWNVYFPHRDRGMDFIATKTCADGVEIIRPVQVKGNYPSKNKSNKTTYGYVGKLNQIHVEMVLAADNSISYLWRLFSKKVSTRLSHAGNLGEQVSWWQVRGYGSAEPPRAWEEILK